jgi:alpha-tubulin suppressor-like RCC1 family protein
MIKKYPLKVISVLLILGILASFIISGRAACVGGKKTKAKTGSSDYNSFTINAPSSLSATAVSFSQIDLTWQNNANNANGFEIERSTSPATGYSLLATVSVNTISYSDTGLATATIYYYRVRAYTNSGDYSGYSNTVMEIPFKYEWLPTSWLAIVARSNQTFALANNGRLWAWGQNDVGQLGLGDTDYRNRIVPTLIASDFNYNVFEDITAVSAGEYHALAIKTDNTLWSWGANGAGQLGFGDTESVDAPFPVTSTVIGQFEIDTDWFTVAAGAGHTIGIKTNATIWVWGLNDYGQLGLGDSNNRTTPTQIGTDSTWSVVNGGSYHTIAIKTNNTIWSWGRNNYGQLGLGDSGYGTDRTTPTKIGSTSDWAETTMGIFHTIARKTNSTLWSWGNTGSTIPTQIGTDSDWSRIATGWWHSISCKSNGTIWTWGSTNLFGELGRSGIVGIPGQVGTDSDWSVVAAGSWHTIAIKTNSIIWSWGSNSVGQLGLGDTIDRNIPCRLGSPIPVTGLTVTAISSSQINLLWTDNSFNENGFQIERGITNSAYSSLITIGPNITSYSDTGLTLGTTYYYRIRTYNAFGNSPYSNEANATTTGIPSLLTLTVISSTQINLSWIDTADNETGFRIERSYNGTGAYVQIDTVGNNVILYSDTTVTAGNTYYYRVRAYNGFGNGSYANEAWLSLFVPNAPSLLTPTVPSLTRIDLSWIDVVGETGYKIERSFAATSTYIQIATVEANVTLYSDTTVTPSNTYYYRIKAYNPLGEGSYSNERSAETVPLRPLNEEIPQNPSWNIPGYAFTGGYRFTSTVNGQITALGRFCHNGGNTTIILWDDTDSQVISATVSAVAGWKWVTLPIPVNITAGTYYRVSVSGNIFYYNQSFSTPTTRGAINITESCWIDGMNVFPSTPDTSNMYGWADIEFVAE